MLGDAASFWTQFRADRQALAAAVAARYPLMSRSYVDYYVSSLGAIEGNPQVLLYVESDLGAPARALALVDALTGGGVQVAGARCLDVGCSNGALLLAARSRGAGACLGIDTSDDRLESARMVCAGSDIELRRADARASLPGRFDLVFCTDVLEHVPGWPRVVERIAEALAPGGSAFVSLHNAGHRQSVLSEPHHGVPGLTLLPAAEAAPLWERVRSALGSTLDYDVYEWPSYAELWELARGLGCTATPWADSEWMDNRFWAGYREQCGALQAEVAAALDRLALPAAVAERLRAAVAAHCERRIAAHERFEQNPADPLALYMVYYAQPINVLLRRA